MDRTAALLAMLSAETPIVQAPIGGCATNELAAEVGRAGGVGGLALTWDSPDSAVGKVKELKRRVGARFFVNYVLRFPPTSLDAVLAEGVFAVTLSWGVDAGLIAKVKARGGRVGVQVGHPLGAKQAAEAGADFIIVQGCEAGGHVQSSTPVSALLAALRGVDLPLPLVAAGGLATSADVRKALEAGADAAMLGTRFVATLEANAHPAYKQALVQATASDTAYTYCFDVGWPFSAVRVLRNETLAAWEGAGCPAPPDRPGENDLIVEQDGQKVLRYSDSAPRATATGNPLAAVMYAGTSVDGIDGVLPAFDVVRRLSR